MLGIKLATTPYHALYTNGQGESIFFFRQLLLKTKKWIHHHHSSGDYNDQSTWGFSYRRALLSANSVIACSKTNAKDIENYLHRIIHSIPCFSRQLKPLKKINQEKLRFGYYGRLIPEKGIETLCALSNDRDLDAIEFHLWGEGPDYSKSYFDDFSKIKYHGSFRGVEELSAVVAFLDCYLLLSTHSEGLPIALLEAMSVGLPWLATDKGGIADIALDPLSTRLISASSKYNEIKSAIISFATDLKSGKVSKESQINLYQNKFSSPLLLKQWLEIFELNARNN
jgi:glycosyltransferase involved in cell wall biosynthesis